jgi:hypothetical protein
MGAARRAAVAFWLALCVCYALGCASPVEAPRPGDLVVLGVAPRSAEVVVASNAQSSASASSSVATVAKNHSDPATFRCADKRCRAGETCCASPVQGYCIPSVDDAARGAIGYLQTQWDQCARLPYERSNWSRIARCDESSDCSEGKVCCEDFLFSGSDGLADCLEMPKTGATPCEFGEVCLDASSCRMPGTTCINGRCRKIPERQRCDKQTCTADAPYCCAGSRGCSADPACGGDRRIACSRHADCLMGERCLDDGGATFCVKAHADPDHASWLCEKTRDCAKVCSGVPGKPTCSEASVAWLKSCSCEEMVIR